MPRDTSPKIGIYVFYLWEYLIYLVHLGAPIHLCKFHKALTMPSSALKQINDRYIFFSANIYIILPSSHRNYCWEWKRSSVLLKRHNPLDIICIYTRFLVLSKIYKTELKRKHTVLLSTRFEAFRGLSISYNPLETVWKWNPLSVT